MKRQYNISHGFGLNGVYYSNGNAQALDKYSMEELTSFVEAGYLTVVEPEVVESEPESQEPTIEPMNEDM